NYLNNNWGSWTFSSPPGACNKIVVHENRGYRTGNNCLMLLDDNTKVVYKGVISDAGNNGMTRSGSGYLLLLYSNVFGGSLSATPSPGGKGSMTRAMSDFAFGTTVPGKYIRASDGSCVDFNGFRVSKDLYWYNDAPQGAFRNCNVDICSTVTSANIMLNFASTPANLFSGPGDMLITGNIITNPGSGMHLAFLPKAGSGTLTYQGVSAFTNWVSVRGGRMVFDYSVNNGRKLAALLDMTNGLGVRAAIEFIGNDSEDTTEAVTDIDPSDMVAASGIRGSYGAGSITIRTGVGRNFTLLARRITRSGGYDGANPLDITLENNGGGVAQVLVSAQGDGVLGGYHTFNKSTWMKISGGAVTGLADIEYDTAFRGDVSGTNVNIDMTADTTIESNAYAQTIRFNSPAATALSVNSGQTLFLPNTGMSYGGILVTPAAGPVVIGGAGIVRPGSSDTLAIHHYGTNALTIGARLGVSSGTESICKVGPGELILTNDLNAFYRLEVFGGTVTLPALRNKNVGQPGGSETIIIGDGTLKYTGAGDVCNRVIGLRGNAVIDASGSGELEFIAAGGSNRVIQFSYNDGLDYPLTLTGTGIGSLNGIMQMSAGNLYKKGSGTWYIGGTLSNLDTYVKEGTLCVTGAIVGDVYVQANG
ncbi:hypothetical protein GX586_03125, partial [bacterium]|nr:hypothetical protein [bacterium]